MIKTRTSITTLSVPWAVGFAPAKKEKGEEIKKEGRKSHFTPHHGAAMRKGGKEERASLYRRNGERKYGRERERKRGYEVLMLLFYAVGHFLREKYLIPFSPWRWKKGSSQVIKRPLSGLSRHTSFLLPFLTSSHSRVRFTGKRNFSRLAPPPPPLSPPIPFPLPIHFSMFAEKENCEFLILTFFRINISD